MQNELCKRSNLHHNKTRNYLTAKTIRKFSDVFLESENFSFIALYLKIDNLSLQTFIADEISLGTSQKNIASRIAQNLIVKIESTLRGELYK